MTEGNLNGAGLKLAIVVARFNELVTRPLLAGARETLSRHWVDVDNDVDVRRGKLWWIWPRWLGD